MRCGIILIHVNDFEENFLLVWSKKSRKWGFPKGGMEEGETFQETAIREFYEETGFHFTKKIKLSKTFTIFNNIYYIITIFNPMTELQETQIPDSEEIAQKKWFSKTDLLKSNILDCNMGLKHWILFLKKKSVGK